MTRTPTVYRTIAATILRETERAIHLRTYYPSQPQFHQKDFWTPLSQVSRITRLKDSLYDEVSVAEWILKEKGLAEIPTAGAEHTGKLDATAIAASKAADEVDGSVAWDENDIPF